MKKLLLLMLAIGGCLHLTASEEDRLLAGSIDAMLALVTSEAFPSTNIFDLIRLNKTNKLDQLLTQQPGLVNMREDDDLGFRPIHAAAEQGNLDVIRILIRHGANVLAVDFLGQTALDRSIDNPAVTRFLINHVQNLAVRRAHTALRSALGRLLEAAVRKGATALEYGDQRSENEYMNLLSFLLDQEGINVDAQNNIDRETALHVAVKNCYVQAVRRLLIAGARVDLRDQNGRTAIAATNDCTNLRQKQEIVQLIRAAENVRNARSILQNGYNRTISIEVVDLIIETMGIEPIQEPDETSWVQTLVNFARSFFP